MPQKHFVKCHILYNSDLQNVIIFAFFFWIHKNNSKEIYDNGHLKLIGKNIIIFLEENIL